MGQGGVARQHGMGQGGCSQATWDGAGGVARQHGMGQGGVVRQL